MSALPLNAPEVAPDTGLASRYTLAQEVAVRAGQRAHEMFRQRERLVVECKGLQDMVTVADRAVEAIVREEIQRLCPHDSVLGEEGGMTAASGEYLWVIDPIDGTACFVNGMHAWCLSIGVMRAGVPVIGVVYDPNADELFHAVHGGGAFVNDKPMRCHAAAALAGGVLGVGFSHRVPVSAFVPFLGRVLDAGGMFIRNGSGALMLAYVAAGRLIGYFEPHINSWDCLAGIVLVQEAGGQVNDFLADAGLTRGNPIIASGPGLYPVLQAAINGPG